MANVKAITVPTDCDGGKSRLEMYINMVQQKQVDYYKRYGFTHSDPDHISADIGNKYARVVKNDANGQSRSVHTFVNLDNGDILKSGSWKAPAPNGARGNIFETDLGESVVNEHGANYLRGPQF